MHWCDEALDHGPIPLWFQIANRLRRSIETGEFKPGDTLPSEARLNEVFGVSRTTARASLDRLEQEGLIVRRSGKGSIVVTPRVEQPLNVLASFSEDMRRRGSTPSYGTLSARVAPVTKEAAKALALQDGDSAYCVSRLLLADGETIAASVAWIPLTIFPDGKPPSRGELGSSSLYFWLEERCGAKIVGGHEYIEAEIASEGLAASLAIEPGSAILVARRRSHGLGGMPIEYAVVRYRADRYRFHIDLVRP